MNKFKIGDKIKRIVESHHNHSVGSIHTVNYTTMDGKNVVRGDDGRIYNPAYYELVKPKPLHPHDEIIRTWLDGETIELFSNGRWVECHDVKTSIKLGTGLIPFHPYLEYRIKPAKSTNQLRKEAIQEEMRKLADELEELEVK